MKLYRERRNQEAIDDSARAETSGRLISPEVRRKLATIALATIFIISNGGREAISSSSQPAGTETGIFIEENEGLANPETLHRAEQIISTFENSTTEIQYDYVETLEDGRGITAGRAGFTSETEDLLYVVQTYVEMGGEGQLAELLPELEEANSTHDIVEEIEGFEEAWLEALEKDDLLKNAQDEVYHEWYLVPALASANELGIETAIGQTIILDTIIQHGEGEDVDGLPNIIHETINAEEAASGQEEDWLRVFLDIRRHHLENAADPATREAWADSVDRVEALRSILESGNLSLDPPISWTVYGDSFTIED